MAGGAVHQQMGVLHSPSTVTFVSAAVAAHGDSIAITFSGAGTSTTGFTAATNGTAPFNTITLGTGSWAGPVLTLPVSGRNILSSASETVTVSGPGAADYTAFTMQATTNSSSVVAKDSVTISQDDGDWQFGLSGQEGVGQQFTAGSSYTAVMVVPYVYKQGTPTGTIRGELLSDSTNTPGSNLTNGTGTSLTASSTLTTTWNTSVILPGLSASITNGTKYWWAVTHGSTDGDASNKCLVPGRSTGGSLSPFQWTGASWGSFGNTGWTANFTIYGY